VLQPRSPYTATSLFGNRKLTKLSFLTLYVVALCCLAPLRSLWLDEVLQLSDTYHHDLYQTIDRVAHNPGGVPLTYIFQNLFVNTLDHPFYAARFLAILWALAGMASLIWLVQLLETAWLPVAVAYALLPISLRYALEVRQYGPALAFSICATAVLVWLDHNPADFRAVIYGAVLALGLYSHPYLAFVIVAHMLWVIGRPSATYVFSASAIAVLCFLPWYVFASGYWNEAVVKEGYQSAFTWKTPLMIPHELSGGGYVLTCAVLALAVFGYRATAIPQSAKRLLLFCILVPLPLVMASNIMFRYFFAIRQLVYIVPPLCIFAVEGLRAIPKTPRTCLTVALLGFALFSDFRLFHQA